MAFPWNFNRQPNILHSLCHHLECGQHKYILRGDNALYSHWNTHRQAPPPLRFIPHVKKVRRRLQSWGIYYKHKRNGHVTGSLIGGHVLVIVCMRHQCIFLLNWVIKDINIISEHMSVYIGKGKICHRCLKVYIKIPAMVCRI